MKEPRWEFVAITEIPILIFISRAEGGAKGWGVRREQSLKENKGKDMGRAAQNVPQGGKKKKRRKEREAIDLSGRAG